MHTQHDEIIVEARDGIEDQVEAIMKESMEEAFKPIIAEVPFVAERSARTPQLPFSSERINATGRCGSLEATISARFLFKLLLLSPNYPINRLILLHCRRQDSNLYSGLLESLESGYSWNDFSLTFTKLARSP